ncbi:YlbE-like family protein [Bacillaceae bacterium IKA-2]|nr:YlbE-like family protein [Bacillaceae bacterium IKA-2]
MRQEIQLYLSQRRDVKQFVRNNPQWYRYLSRNPQSISELDEQVKYYYGKTFPQKLDRFQSNLNMAMMLFNMARGK